MPHDHTPDETDNDPKTKYEDMGIHPHPSMLPIHGDGDDRTSVNENSQKNE